MRIWSFLLVVLVSVVSCRTQPCQPYISYQQNDLHRHVDLPTLFAPATERETMLVKKTWDLFDPNSESHQVLQASNFEVNRKVELIEHTAEGKKHHGVLLYPADYDINRSYPCLVWAHGLNQRDPYVRFNYEQYVSLSRRLPDYAIIIPSYRGQALEYYGSTFCNDGFFGDAYDGATDDAIRLLHLVASHYVHLDRQRMAICGVSRGGNVALLLASRAPELKCAIAIAAPTDFLRREVYDRYGFQFKYQFLSWPASISDIRHKIIASSPVYFIEGYQNNLLLIQGMHDRIVPPENGQAINEVMKNSNRFEFKLTEGGHRFQDWNLVFEWLKKHN